MKYALARTVAVFLFLMAPSHAANAFPQLTCKSDVRPWKISGLHFGICPSLGLQKGVFVKKSQDQIAEDRCKKIDGELSTDGKACVLNAKDASKFGNKGDRDLKIAILLVFIFLKGFHN